jgi:hypothetical protein
LDASFLEGVVTSKKRWHEPSAQVKGVSPAYRWTGPGTYGLEVVHGTADSRPDTTTVRGVWKARHGHRAAPLLIVVSYPSDGEHRAVVCGPAGDDPRVVYLDYEQAERLAAAALGEPDRHLAIRFLSEALEGEPDEHPGLRNKGLFATHELLYGVPKRDDWEAASTRSRPLLGRRGQDLVRGLGYEIDQRARHSVLRSSEDRAQAVAVFLQESEQADQPSSRFENQTPVSYALYHAERDNIPWVVAERSGAVRLYSTSTSGAAGQRGRTETFVELNLPLLPTDQAGYLDLLFSSSALAENGTVSQIQQASSIFTSNLSDRLRERVYKQVVPSLAVAVANHDGGTSEKDLERHYRTALTILFRLMFVAYAEDSRLLPLNVYDEYTRNSLKTIARDQSGSINEGHNLGFDNSLTGEVEENPSTQTLLWSKCKALFEAVRKGEESWGVPAYDGGLFSDNPKINPVGKIIKDLTLTNGEFGPALTALIVDRSPDGVIGPIDFRSLSVREFGTIYEGLLESELSVAEQPLTVNSDGVYLPARADDTVVVETGDVYLHNQSGVRKSTGSYFTKPFAVNHLISHSVDPTLKEHLDQVKVRFDQGREADAAEMLFDFRVADIAMGSGHFLTAVVDRLEAHYSNFLHENKIPQVNRELDLLRETAKEALGQLADAVEIENSSLLRRLIARRCVYGVDMNPLAVELARVGMWIHTFVPGLPLSFLDHNFVAGDSLTGIGTIEEATNELVSTGAQASFFDDPILEGLGKAREPLRRLANIADATVADVTEAREAAAAAEVAVAPIAGLFDLAVAARIGEAERPSAASIDELMTLETAHASEVARAMRAVHFPIAFPEVFLRDRPGFDALVGNPPWEETNVEKLGFWALRFPGLKSLSQAKQKREVERLERERPDIVSEYESAVDTSRRISHLLLAGQYPGMGASNPDLYKAFCWRFWNLARTDGAVGFVLPRSALSGSSMSLWRDAVLDGGTFDVTFLLNTRGWVFDEAEHRYTIGLVKLLKGEEHTGKLRLRGPYPSRQRYDAAAGVSPVEFSTAAFRTWTATASFPLLPSPDAAKVFAKLRACSRLDDDSGEWQVIPTAELNATTDKKHMIIQDEPPAGAWPVYKGASFDLWKADTKDYYAWAAPGHITAVLQGRRQRNARTTLKAFPPEWAANPETLPCLHPRIAFRDVSRATDTRTVRAALIPGKRVGTNKAPYLIWPRGDATDEAYLLGVLASMPLDWYARRFVETSLNFHILRAFPIPRPDRDDLLRAEIVRISGRLAAVDDRFLEWASEVGVPVGSVSAGERDGLIAQLDAAVALLYELDENELQVVYSTFHEGWDYEPRLTAVLDHHRQLASARRGA